MLGDIFHAGVFISGYEIDDHTPYTDNQRRKVVMSGINDQWQADLVDVSSLASSNDKHTFILTVIDVFSKVGYAQPL